MLSAKERKTNMDKCESPDPASAVPSKLVIMLARALEPRQEITITGDMIDDDELAALTALLMAAD